MLEALVARGRDSHHDGGLAKRRRRSKIPELRSKDGFKPIPLPDLCSTHHDWNPISAASSQSAIAAVLAGFVFLGIIAVVTVKAQKRDDAGRALRLLLTAFLGLAVTAYLFADLAGEQTCPRAETTEALAGGMLGTFAIVMMVSLTWLLLAYEQDDANVFKYFRGLICVASAFVVLLLTTNSEGYLSAVLQHGSHTVFNSAVYSTGAISVLMPGVMILLGSRSQKVRDSDIWKRWFKSKGDTVRLCTRATLGFLTISSITAGVILSIPAKSWYPQPPPWLAYAAAWMALILPLAVLASALRALARPTPPAELGVGRPSAAAVSREYRASVRAWAREVGLAIADHGRISAEVIRQYEAAHS